MASPGLLTWGEIKQTNKETAKGQQNTTLPKIGTYN